ncbi:hypothetical protein BH23PLA1_BH23PLA1_10150 [soil metagenome]
MRYRLAIVQHGDYADALRIIQSGEPEPYTGMSYSVETLERLCAGIEHLIVSLDASRYHIRRDMGELVGFSAPLWKKGRKLPWSWMAYRAVRAFRPTHVLVRTGGILALPILEDSTRRGLDTLVLMAGMMMPTGRWHRLINPPLVRRLNHPSVSLVGNHRRPAADSLIAAGVHREKVVAYDWPGQPHPSEHPPKSGPPPGPCHVVFAGTMVVGKGIGDLLEAIGQLSRDGLPVRLTACGEGPELPALRRRAEALPPGTAEFPGRIPNSRVRDLMREATFVCVASRRDQSEGLPFAVTEALAARTPLMASDHPCLTPLLHDGEGLRFFQGGDLADLTRVIREVIEDPESYARLSESTAAAFARIECPTLFHELLEHWRASW